MGRNATACVALVLATWFPACTRSSESPGPIRTASSVAPASTRTPPTAPARDPAPADAARSDEGAPLFPRIEGFVERDATEGRIGSTFRFQQAPSRGSRVCISCDRGDGSCFALSVEYLGSVGGADRYRLAAGQDPGAGLVARQGVVTYRGEELVFHRGDGWTAGLRPQPAPGR